VEAPDVGAVAPGERPALAPDAAEPEGRDARALLSSSVVGPGRLEQLGRASRLVTAPPTRSDCTR